MTQAGSVRPAPREVGLVCEPWEVRAILEGRKTQKRVLAHLPASPDHLGQWEPTVLGGKGTYTDLVRRVEAPECVALWHTRTGRVVGARLRVGDMMCVRETWGVGTRPDPNQGWRDGIEYEADVLGLAHEDALPLHEATPPVGKCLDDYNTGHWRSARRMPLWVSRIRRPVTRVWAQRLQEVSEEDAKAEGVEPPIAPSWRKPGTMIAFSTYREEYERVWNEINGPGSWERNQWVFGFEWEVA